MQTARRILEHLHRAKLDAGARLREEELVGLLGVSRTPVRAALRMLADQGILLARPRHGYVMQRNAGAIEESLELSPSADEALYRQLARDRVANRVPQSVSETSLMRQYGASRNLVSAALSRLSEEGLARRGEGRNWSFVDTLNAPGAQRESYYLRLAIEPAGLRLPTFQPDMAELESLRARHRAMLPVSQMRPSAPLLFHIDASFHEALAQMSGNSLFLGIIRTQNQVRRLIEYEGYGNVVRVQEWCEEHLAVLDRLVDGDIEAAATLLHRHLTNALAALD
jgi:DNA-binding GntR family transcriptional regulator